MRVTNRPTALGVLPLAAIALSGPVHSQAPAERRIAATELAVGPGSNAAALADLRRWTVDVVDRTRQGELRPIPTDADVMVAGRQHERLLQYHRGVRVFGGDLTRQTNDLGQTVSIFGTLYENVDIDVVPAIGAGTAAALLADAGRGALGFDHQFELVILPRGSMPYRLAWTARVSSATDGAVRRIFIDAGTGVVIDEYDDTWTQTAATGTGNGVVGDRLKVNGQLMGGQYITVNAMQPGSNTTYDMRANPTRTQQILSGAVAVAASDVAVDDDNLWTDAGVVSAHAYATWTYEYYRRRFGRNGLDNRNLRIRSFVNPARPQDASQLGGQFPLFFNNAAYYGAGYIAYGVGSVNAAGTVTFRNFAGALDVVAHELSHGVTAYTSNLIYRDESGALNEAFSDIMGTAVEFEWQTAGSGPGRAEWLEGEDLSPSGTPIRSLVAPSTRGHPDHYSIRFTGTTDNGGVHTNSSIANHMFYLAVAGGTHRLSGQTVQGVGLANRDAIEKVVYRGFTGLLPSNATFSMARAATIQAARDLYGAGSTVERAIVEAWSAVGVQ